ETGSGWSTRFVVEQKIPKRKNKNKTRQKYHATTVSTAVLIESNHHRSKQQTPTHPSTTNTR
ncbi:hypothetical protein QIH36_27900, partial [Klebsiella pneumoniae]|nr:hypothetical protein [Klebsiella pneumoniae]